MIEALLFGTKPGVVVNQPVDQLRRIKGLEIAAGVVGCGNDQRTLIVAMSALALISLSSPAFE